jgi:hypothetical protein
MALEHHFNGYQGHRGQDGRGGCARQGCKCISYKAAEE